MDAVLQRNLPGVGFETVRAPLDEALPRMDVAAFVGFAASGPVNVPVAIEQPGEFRGIFGDDQPLAWDLQRGRMVHAHLGAAVRAFFRNGGRRCWVVRVAAAPVANTFLLPNLLAWSAAGGLRPASAVARSEGSWSDRLEVATLIRRDPVAAHGVTRVGAALEVASPGRPDVQPGDLVRLTFHSGPRAFGAVAAIGDLTAGETRLRLEPVIWLDSAFTLANPGQPLPPLASAERLELDLLVRQDDAEPARAERLGLAAGHARCWASVPTDAAFFAPWADPLAGAQDAVRLGGTRARFPLAGSSTEVTLTIPTADLAVPVYASLPRPGLSAARRDGLEGFSASLFIDERLRASGATALMGLAESIRYHNSTWPVALDGMHAALFLDEATLIAIPDAVHRPWSVLPETEPEPSRPLAPEAPPPPCCGPSGPFDDRDPDTLAPPVLAEPTRTAVITLSWTGEGDRFTVEEAASPRFDDWQEVATVRGRTLDIHGRPPGVYAFRVRAHKGARVSLASAGRTVTVPSQTRAVVSADSFDDRALLDVHRALLRVCAARGDLFAVLALPDTYREAEATAHLGALTSGAPARPSATVAALGAGEAHALSYGALYHPWLIVSGDTGGPLRRLPPDGAACGVIARRTLARGAWVAPANETLDGVVALTPSLRRDERSRRDLLNAQLNVFTHEPAGFLALSADTLSRDRDLLPINVRRLLALIRRRALQVGTRYVFETNDAALSRLVERSFGAMLGHLYEQGAFAGKTAASSYQVVVDEGLNTPRSRDAGRFVAELRVAPSWPLTFLRVRLVQEGDRLSASEER